MTKRRTQSKDALTVIEPSRRDVIGQLATCGCAFAVASLAGCTFADVYGSLEAKTVDFDLSAARFEALREVGGMVPIDEGGWCVVLVRRSMSEVIALDRMCPHEWCDMTPGAGGMWVDDTLMCLCHGSQFDVQGKVLTGPAVTDIPAYRVEFDTAAETGRLFIELQGQSPGPETSES